MSCAGSQDRNFEPEISSGAEFCKLSMPGSRLQILHLPPVSVLLYGQVFLLLPELGFYKQAVRPRPLLPHVLVPLSLVCVLLKEGISLEMSLYCFEEDVSWAEIGPSNVRSTPQQSQDAPCKDSFLPPLQHYLPCPKDSERPAAQAVDC